MDNINSQQHPNNTLVLCHLIRCVIRWASVIVTRATVPLTVHRRALEAVTIATQDRETNHHHRRSVWHISYSSLRDFYLLILYPPNSKLRLWSKSLTTSNTGH